MEIRDARADELAEVGDIRVEAYVAGGHMSPDSQYAPVLRALGADGGHVLVAVDQDGQLVGTVMLQTWPLVGNIVQGPEEAEVRALAVRPAAHGGGTGRALVAAIIERALRENIEHLLLYTQPDMIIAHGLYEDAGFVRLPERDWAPEPGVDLLAYGLALDLLVK